MSAEPVLGPASGRTRAITLARPITAHGELVTELTIADDAVETDLELADPSAYLREPPEPGRDEASGRKTKKSADELEQQLRELGW